MIDCNRKVSLKIAWHYVYTEKYISFLCSYRVILSGLFNLFLSPSPFLSQSFFFSRSFFLSLFLSFSFVHPLCHTPILYLSHSIHKLIAHTTISWIVWFISRVNLHIFHYQTPDARFFLIHSKVLLFHNLYFTTLQSSRNNEILKKIQLDYIKYNSNTFLPWI